MLNGTTPQKQHRNKGPNMLHSLDNIEQPEFLKYQASKYLMFCIRVPMLFHLHMYKSSSKYAVKLPIAHLLPAGVKNTYAKIL